jgi:DNA polymerase (family 10)
MTTRRYSNRQLAEIFNKIADLLEIKGDDPFKIRAYRRAAESLESLGQDAGEFWQQGSLTQIPGIGKAIAEKIDELYTTGRLEFLEKLESEVPPSLISLLQVPDMGPKKVALVWKQLGVTTVEALQAAAKAGKLQSLPGMGAKSEAKIIQGIESLKRRSGRTPLATAWPMAMELIAALRGLPGVFAAEPAGSLRRWRVTVGDLDILVAARDSAPVMQAFTSYPGVVRVLGQGPTKSSVEFSNGMRAQVWVHPPERFGTALQYATGSKDHNVRLRELALARGLSLSEHALTRKDGSEILCATEEEVYSHLGLPWIPPELREDRGEVQAAQAGRLPRSIESTDLVSELHSHSTWSDGRATILEMAQAAKARGYGVLAVTDHTSGLGIVGGLAPQDLARQRAEIHAVQRQVGPELRLLQGVELEIRADGSLDYPDEVLASLDIVVASLHMSLRQPRQQITQRLLNAIRNPHVDIIGHPTGRLIPDREGADLDMDAILAAAAETGVALEINANPHRLDLDDIYARRAVEMGIPISINTDAHHPDQFGYSRFGLATARRGWVPPERVINTWSPDKLGAWLAGRGGA